MQLEFSIVTVLHWCLSMFKKLHQHWSMFIRFHGCLSTSVELKMFVNTYKYKWTLISVHTFLVSGIPLPLINSHKYSWTLTNITNMINISACQRIMINNCKTNGLRIHFRIFNRVQALLPNIPGHSQTFHTIAIHFYIFRTFVAAAVSGQGFPFRTTLVVLEKL